MGVYMEKLGKIDFSHIKAKMQRNTGMDHETALQAEELYKQYLALRAKHPHANIIPPKLADHMWHEHILSSRQYMEDCNNIFGDYLHHNQVEDKDLLDEGWENSKNLYQQEFGVDLISRQLSAGECT